MLELLQVKWYWRQMWLINHWSQVLKGSIIVSTNHVRCEFANVEAMLHSVSAVINLLRHLPYRIDLCKSVNQKYE